jgi:hypothetical protein
MTSIVSIASPVSPSALFHPNPAGGFPSPGYSYSEESKDAAQSGFIRLMRKRANRPNAGFLANPGDRQQCWAARNIRKNRPAIKLAAHSVPERLDPAGTGGPLPPKTHTRITP